jgi:Protein of unknown function (DUF3237)
VHLLRAQIDKLGCTFETPKKTENDVILKQILQGLLCVLALTATVVRADQTTQISTEYLMTFYAPLDAQQIDASLTIFNVRDGSWVKGPKINGTLLAPAADWLRVMPSGSSRVDVRGTIKTDDGALIYITYGGVISHTKESLDRLMKGEVLTSKDHYFITSPTMQTSSEKYAWLNHVQCVGKVVEVKVGENSYVKYDIYVVR